MHRLKPLLRINSPTNIVLNCHYVFTVSDYIQSVHIFVYMYLYLHQFLDQDWLELSLYIHSVWLCLECTYICIYVPVYIWITYHTNIVLNCHYIFTVADYIQSVHIYVYILETNMMRIYIYTRTTYHTNIVLNSQYIFSL